MGLAEILLTLSTDMLVNYIWVIAFFAPHLSGEIAILTLGFFSAQGLYPLWIIIVIPIIGNLIMDGIIILLLKTKSFLWIKEKTIHKSKKYFALEKHIENISQGKDWIIVFLTKFMFGARNLLFIYLSNKNFSLKRYYKYAIFSIPLYINVLAFSGYYIGLQFTNINDIYGNIKLGLGFLAGIFLFLFLGSFILKEIIMHYENKSRE